MIGFTSGKGLNKSTLCTKHHFIIKPKRKGMLKAAICDWRARGSSRHITKTLIVMKLTIVLLTAALLNVQAKGVSQTVSFSAENASLKEVFAAIKKQTGFVVLYNKVYLNDARPVSVKAVNVPLTSFLDQVFKHQPVDYSIQGNTISINRKVATSPKGSGVDDVLPPGPVKGIVRDADGKALSGVNIIVKGTQRGTTTDANGLFTISAEVGNVLIISYVGYQSTEYKIMTAVAASSDRQLGSGAEGPIIITLLQSQTELDEVKIIGYGQTTQRYSTGNVSTIK
ncbi:MAG TPA: carboxypeptidase-like regulatory domain-containing protein, partial [Chitinophaga sp.]|nr:carboxypeptidase-like regulatory domain-containing protein [Chitinophaga sp.]